MVDKGDIVGDASLGGKVLEVGDILLKPIIHNAIRAFEGFLSELGELETCGCLGIIGKEGGLKVGCKLVEGFLGVSDRGIRHPVIPHLRERDSASLTHLVEHGHDFVGVRGVNCRIDRKVGLHGLDSSYCVRGFS